MSDEKLRELERRWKETGAPEDEEAYLVEQVRTGEALDWDGYSRLSELNLEAAAEYLQGRVERGELTHKGLEFAAYCGDLPALVCFKAEQSSEASASFQLSSDRASIVASILVASRVLSIWEGSHLLREGDGPPLGIVDSPRQALLRLRAWAELGSSRNREELVRAQALTRECWKWVADRWGIREERVWGVCLLVIDLIDFSLRKAAASRFDTVLDGHLRRIVGEELSTLLSRPELRLEIRRSLLA